MHVTLIQPSVGRKADGTPYPASWRMEPLGIAVLSGLTPSSIQRTFFDDRLEPVDYGIATDLVAITVETFTARRAYQIAARFRARGVPVVVGGFHPTLVPEEAAAHADAIVVGEAEPVWAGLLADAAAHRLQRRYVPDRRPATFGTPDRSIFGTRDYGPVSLVETSRGCRLRCGFCSICRFYRHTCVEREVDDVAREVRLLRKPIFFIDDNIGVNPARLRRLCETLLPLRRRWIGQVGLQIADDDALLDLLRRSGCEGVLIGFESLDAATLIDMDKNANAAADYARVVKAFRNQGMAIYATFVFGYDRDTPETFRRVLDFSVREALFFAAFNHLVPFPGTPIYEQLTREGRLLSPHWWLDPGFRFGDVVFKPAHLTPAELAGLCEEYRRRFYAPASILRRAADVRANCRHWRKALVFLAQNALHHGEIRRRQGLPFGFPEAVP